MDILTIVAGLAAIGVALVAGEVQRRQTALQPIPVPPSTKKGPSRR